METSWVEDRSSGERCPGPGAEDLVLSTIEGLGSFFGRTKATFGDACPGSTALTTLTSSEEARSHLQDQGPHRHHERARP
jgi:hypothetical protein